MAPWTPLLIALAAACLCAYMVYEARWRGFEVTRLDLQFDNLPPAFDGFRVVFVSDFHCRGLGRFQRLAIEQIAKIDADLLVIGGDLKARNTTPNEPVLEVLDRLLEATRRYPHKPVYVRGNHDRRGFSAACNGRQDIHALRDRSIALERDGQTISIAGTRRTARATRRMRPAIRKALQGIDPQSFLIFASHSPDFFRMGARRGVDLMLSGDTHGGQITLPWIGALQQKSRLGRLFCRGHIQAFGSQLYVTRGVGTTGPPFRLFCRPEVSALTLRRRGEKGDGRRAV